MIDEFNILVKNQNKLIQLVKSLQETNKSLEDRIISLEFPTTLHDDGDFFSSFYVMIFKFDNNGLFYGSSTQHTKGRVSSHWGRRFAFS